MVQLNHNGFFLLHIEMNLLRLNRVKEVINVFGELKIRFNLFIIF